jgi:hypothetical protein
MVRRLGEPQSLSSHGAERKKKTASPPLNTGHPAQSLVTIPTELKHNFCSLNFNPHPLKLNPRYGCNNNKLYVTVTLQQKVA